MQILIVLALVFASFVAIFALQNAQTVPIRIFTWERETSVAVIVLATAAIGALSAVLAGVVRQFKAGIRLRQVRGELAKVSRLLEEERERATDLQSRLDAFEAPIGEKEAPTAAPPPAPGAVSETNTHVAEPTDPSNDPSPEAGADREPAP